MRFVVPTLLLLLSACAPRVAPSTPADWAALADVLSSEEYAETVLDELDARLDRADHDLSGDQRRSLYAVLHAGAEVQRATALRVRGATAEQQPELRATLAAESARTDGAAEALLTPAQIPVYRTLMAEVRAYLLQQATSG